MCDDKYLSRQLKLKLLGREVAEAIYQSLLSKTRKSCGFKLSIATVAALGEDCTSADVSYFYRGRLVNWKRVLAYEGSQVMWLC